MSQASFTQNNLAPAHTDTSAPRPAARRRANDRGFRSADRHRRVGPRHRLDAAQILVDVWRRLRRRRERRLVQRTQRARIDLHRMQFEPRRRR